MSNKQNDDLMDRLNDSFREEFQLESEASFAEHEYYTHKIDALTEALINLMPHMTPEQVETIHKACEVDLYERDSTVNEYAESLPF